MSPEQEAILSKMVLVLNSARPQDKDAVRRFFSLANRRLHETEFSWGLCGASYAVLHGYERKFGEFVTLLEPVTVVDRG